MIINTKTEVNIRIFNEEKEILKNFYRLIREISGDLNVSDTEAFYAVCNTLIDYDIDDLPDELEFTL